MGSKEERKERAHAAFRAMKDLGIPEEKTKNALKKLLKLYDKNWGLIEEENYRVLADAIFDDDDGQQDAGRKMTSENMDMSNGFQPREAFKEEAETQDEPERPLKRLRLKHQDGSNPESDGTLSKKPKVVHGTGHEAGNQQVWDMILSPSSNGGSYGADSLPVSPTRSLRNKGKQPVSPQVAVALLQPAPSANKITTGRTPGALQIKEPRPEQVVTSTARQKFTSANSLTKVKDEPFTDDMPVYQAQLAVLRPESSLEHRTSNGNGFVQRNHRNQAANSARVTDSSSGEQRNLNLSNVHVNSPTTLEIAASHCGKVKLSLMCNFVPQRPNSHAPSLEKVMKYMKDKCLHSYKIIDPSFSVEKLMRDFCESFLELGSKSTVYCKKEPVFILTPAGEELIKSAPFHGVSPVDNGETGDMSLCSLNGPISGDCSDNLAASQVPNPPLALHSLENGLHGSNIDNEFSGDTNSNSMVVVPYQLNSDDIRRLHDVNDIARGEEKVAIPLLHDSNSELLPSFHYIPLNVVSEAAQVNISLAQFWERDFCLTCYGDCLHMVTTCACVSRNGENFAYSSDGVIKDEDLENCITIIRNLQKDHLIYCKECPLERLKSDDMLEQCKGHLRRKFIKECWSKCGCSKNCVNRLVQRGITMKLQVFLTSEGKGWGLRPLEDLPKGAFVCEYVGEILNVIELRQRILKRTSDKHAYVMMLDADWGSGVIKDEQALCLDATSYGNVARFINHRCFDANLVHVPVEVDTTNHLYYHVALFTTRKVNALEELTWDYGVDFDDPDQHLKPFSCLCGSTFCRNMKRSNRTRAASVSH